MALFTFTKCSLSCKLSVDASDNVDALDLRCPVLRLPSTLSRCHIVLLFTAAPLIGFICCKVLRSDCDVRTIAMY